MNRRPWAHRRTRVNQPVAELSGAWRKRAHEHVRPFPVAALARRLGVDPGATGELALRLGIDRRWVRRYRQWGLTIRQADQWAARAGVHPAEVWPIWDELDRLRGAALRNAARETCPAGHPLERFDSAGRRRCWPCPAEATRRWREKKSANSQVAAVITQEAS